MSPKKLSAVIKTLREKDGLSQQAPGETGERDRRVIAMLEMGKRKNPSLRVLKRLARALVVPVAALLEEIFGRRIHDTSEPFPRTDRGNLACPSGW
jgi:transcriptional regulator with XRE-family HTH domain